MSQCPIRVVSQTSKKPSAIFRIDKISLLRANVWIFRHRSDFWTSVTRSGLRGPNADFPSIIKDKTVGTTIFENGIVILVLVKLDTTIKLWAIRGMSVVTLSGTLQSRLGTFSESGNAAFFVDDANNPSRNKRSAKVCTKCKKEGPFYKTREIIASCENATAREQLQNFIRCITLTLFIGATRLRLLCKRRPPSWMRSWASSRDVAYNHRISIIKGCCTKILSLQFLKAKSCTHISNFWQVFFIA